MVLNVQRGWCFCVWWENTTGRGEKENILGTYIKFKSLHSCSVGTRHGCKEPQHLLDDTVQVFEAHDGVEPQLSFRAQASIVEQTPGPQLLPQPFQDSRVAEELHDEGSAGAGRGGEGSKDQLNGRLLWDERLLLYGQNLDDISLAFVHKSDWT